MNLTDFTIAAATARQADMERAAAHSARVREARRRRTARAHRGSGDGATAQARLRPRLPLRLLRLFRSSPTAAASSPARVSAPVHR